MTTTATYRKTRQGVWVVFGPTSIVKPGQVTVTKRDGSTKVETIDSVGKSFTANGITCCYGYIATPASSRTASRSHGHRCESCGRSGAHFASDMSGIGGWACRTCDDGSLSFC